MKLSRMEQKQFQELIKPFVKQKHVLRMKHFIQHGKITTYQHCFDVAKISFWLNRRLHLHANEKNLVTGACLHDFYLYDWHDKRIPFHNVHGFFHSAIACRNAERIFHINGQVKNIIASHMWPLTLRKIPKCREAWIVCIADKYCSTIETLFKR